jgi:hypothetical protein
MTPDQNELVSRLHRQVGHLPYGQTVELKAGDVVKLINFLKMEERAACVAETRARRLLTRAADEKLEELLITAPPPPRTEGSPLSAIAGANPASVPGTASAT